MFKDKSTDTRSSVTSDLYARLDKFLLIPSFPAVHWYVALPHRIHAVYFRRRKGRQ